MKLFVKIIPITAILALGAGAAAFADKDAKGGVHTNPQMTTVGKPAVKPDVDRANPHRNPHGMLVGKHHAKMPNMTARITTVTPTSVTVRMRNGVLRTYAITPAQYAMIRSDVGGNLVYNLTGGTFVIVNR
ncbi:MAG: hypothetical protein ABR584_05920 [Candidatus Baltobacteraceae bacterium]